MGNNDLDISILDSIWLMDNNVTARAEVMRMFIYINKYAVCGSSKLQKGMVHGCTASTTMLAGRSRSSTLKLGPQKSEKRSGKSRTISQRIGFATNLMGIS